MNDFDPYTVNTNLVGSNISKGPNQCQEVMEYMTPTGEGTIIAANKITISVTNREGYFKELLRMLGYKQGGGGCMAGTPQPMTNEEAGMINTNCQMGRARFYDFTNNTEGIKGMGFLEDELNLKKTPTKNDENKNYLIKKE